MDIDTMVSVGTVKGNKSPRSRSKQFTLLIGSLGVMMIVWLYSANPGRESRGTSATETPRIPASVSEAMLEADQRLSTNFEYSDLKQKEEKEKPRKIRQISLIGERNSGTRWSWSHLNECFNHSIPVERHLTRYKHWFQYPNYTAYPHDTLVIAQFRNPYDWLKAMQRVPHHSPSHLDKKWKDFLSIPWTTPRVGEDIEIGKTITAANNSTDTTPCQQNFIYQDINSCVIHPLPKESYKHKLRFSEDTPIYEHRIDHSGLPYANIMEMRAAKIENFLDVQNYPGIAAVWAVQYEFLLQRGTEHLVERVAEWTGIKPKCKPVPPQLRRERPFEPGFVEYVTKHLNWTAEHLIGYGKYKQKLPSKEDA